MLLESDDVPQEAPPVQARNLYVVPFRWPAIDRVVSQAGADQAIAAGSTLLAKERADVCHDLRLLLPPAWRGRVQVERRTSEWGVLGGKLKPEGIWSTNVGFAYSAH